MIRFVRKPEFTYRPVRNATSGST